MDRLNALLDRIREGEADLELKEDGRTALSEEPIYELRLYISALEAGYRHLRTEHKACKQMEREMFKSEAEKVLGLTWDEITEAAFRAKPRRVECVIFGCDSFRYGNCPSCAALVNEGKNESCHICGQVLDWSEG